MNVRAGLHGVQRAWERLSLPERLLTACYALLALSALAPWVQGEPFMNGFMGAEEQPPTVFYGWEAAGPLFAVALVGLLALLLVRHPRVRRLAQLGAWAILGLAALSATVWTEYLCLLCEDREVLWGVDLFRGGAIAGLCFATYDFVVPHRDGASS